MTDSDPRTQSLELALPDEAATGRLGQALARIATAGDVIALSGDLGAGKTSLARAFITALAPEPPDEVPSPTFTLVQIYESPPAPVWHFDLYRIERPEEALELGLEDALAEGISLIEWPERLGALLPDRRLQVELQFGARPEARRAVLNGGADWAARLGALRLTEPAHD